MALQGVGPLPPYRKKTSSSLGYSRMALADSLICFRFLLCNVGLIIGLIGCAGHGPRRSVHQFFLSSTMADNLLFVHGLTSQHGLFGP